MKKILLIVLDGLADDKIPELNYQTPLEAAKTPNFDFLAKEGICGTTVCWTKKGEVPTSEDTHFAIFGYNPEKFNPGRGVLEALGASIKIEKNDIFFRGNFATVDDNLIIIDRRAQRIEKTEKLIEALNKIKVEGAKIFLKKTFGHRFVLRLRGKGLSEKVSSNDPKKVGAKVLEILPLSKKAKKTAKILKEFLKKAKEVLQKHPENKKRKEKGKLMANYLLLRGASKMRKIESFQKKYGLKAAFVAGGTLYKGIAKYLGQKEIKVEGTTGMANTNLRGKILAAKKALKRFDFVFLHIKAADTFSEDGDFLGKMKFLEKVDKNLKPLLDLKDVLIVITGDHPTSSLLKSHKFGKNPVLIFGAKKDNVEKFSEKDCEKGGLGNFPQIELMKKIIFLAKS